MKQITKFTAVLAIITLLASCQSSKSGCYEFGAINKKTIKTDVENSKSGLIFTNVVCKP